MAVSSLADFRVEAPSRNHRGLRSPNPLKWVVIHSAVCCDGGKTGAESLARYLRDGAGGRRVSWHYSTDSDSIASSLSEKYAGRHTGSSYVDGHSIAIEMAVFVPGDWSKSNYKKTLEKTAELTADICLRNNIPPEILSATQLRGDQSGIISHNLSRIVFGGTTHTDPGPDFPWGLFAERVSHFYNKSADSPVQSQESVVVAPPSGILRFGSSGAEVSKLQRSLKIKVDGQFGSITKAAVVGLQIAQGLKVDGLVGSETFQSLENPIENLSVQISTWLPEILYRGKNGGERYKHLVSVWQERLRLEVNGDFDTKTEAATLGFQTGVPGLDADGIVGKQTWGTAMKGF